MGILLTVAGCGASGAAGSPRATLEALSRASRAGNVDALYALLPERARRQESLASFRARMQPEAPELRALSEDVDRALTGDAEPRVEVPLESGGAVAVLEDPEGWRVAQPGFGPAFAVSPTAAAQALRSALDRRSLPAVLDVLSARARGSLQAEIDALREALRDPSALEVTSTSSAGQRVEMHLPDGRTLVLTREGQNWRVDDVR